MFCKMLCPRAPVEPPSVRYLHPPGAHLSPTEPQVQYDWSPRVEVGQTHQHLPPVPGQTLDKQCHPYIEVRRDKIPETRGHPKDTSSHKEVRSMEVRGAQLLHSRKGTITI